MIVTKGLVLECKGTHSVRSKVKLLICYPYASLDRSYGSWSLRLPGFLDNRHMNVARLSALHTSRLYLQETFLVLISVRGRDKCRTIVQPEVLNKRKILMSTPVNRTANFRLVPQCVKKKNCTTYLSFNFTVEKVTPLLLWLLYFMLNLQ